MKLLRRLFRPTRPAPPSPPLPADHWTAEENERLRLLLELVGPGGQPNINQLSLLTRNLDAAALNIKAMGYDLARRLGEALPVRTGTAAQPVGLACTPSPQADIESDWVAHWCAELRIPVVFHRKIWEVAYVLQALFEGDVLRPDARGLGFGCGIEPLPSYFANLGVDVTMTDLPSDDARSREWHQTGQFAPAPEAAWHPHLVDRATFDARVRQRAVDMNAIPGDLSGYDFCWSVCAMEHLGSIEQGLAFVENSLAPLKPGGVSVHTMEFNINPDGPTVDNWLTVFFQRRHIEALAARLCAAGHHVAPLDFDPGDRPMDRFVDLPPWHEGTTKALAELAGQSLHLKVAADGFVVTCFGMIVTKGGG